MKPTGLISFLILMLSLVSCGKPNSGAVKTVRLSENDLVKLMEDHTFHCSPVEGNECPTGIAKVAIFNQGNPAKSRVCTGFLNGNNRLVTNNHCISTLRECENTYIVIHGGPVIYPARCQNIIRSQIDTLDESRKTIDFTVMELDRKIYLRSFPLSQSKPRSGETVTAWVIDHLTVTESRIAELTCTNSANPYQIELRGCSAIQGNSGAPVLNQSGEVVGVLWGSTADPTLFSSSTPLTQRRGSNDVAVATDIKHLKMYLSP